MKKELSIIYLNIFHQNICTLNQCNTQSVPHEHIPNQSGVCVRKKKETLLQIISVVPVFHLALLGQVQSILLPSENEKLMGGERTH